MDDGWWMIRGIYMYCIYIYIYLCQRQRELGFLSFFFGLYVDRIFFHGMDVRQSSQPSRGGGIIIYSRMLLKFDWLPRRLPRSLALLIFLVYISFFQLLKFSFSLFLFLFLFFFSPAYQIYLAVFFCNFYCPFFFWRNPAEAARIFFFSSWAFFFFPFSFEDKQTVKQEALSVTAWHLGCILRAKLLH